MINVNEPASLPPPEKSGSLQTKLAALIQELRRSCRDYGLESDDPFSPVMKALILVLEWLGTFAAELRTITIDYGKQAVERLQASRAADAAATLHLQTHMESVRLKLVHEFRSDLSRDFTKVIARLVWVQAGKISLIGIFVFTASIGASLLGGIAYGYQWGQNTAQSTDQILIHETEVGLRAAFKSGLPNAIHWLGLMTWNDDIEASLVQCYKDPKLDISEKGRRACHVPLWIEGNTKAPDFVMDYLTAGLIKDQALLEQKILLAEAEQLQAKVKEVEEKRAAVKEAEEKPKAEAAAEAKPKPEKPVPHRRKTSR